MKSNDPSFLPAAEWLLRLGLAAGFLAAVADRLGLCGAPGSSPNIAWGDWAHFRSYSDMLNHWLPAALRSAAAVTATIAEAALGLGLLVPWRTKWIAGLSGLLLVSFALTMTFVLGPKAPLNYSVWSAAGGALVLAAISRR
ncbi:MAG: DoxX family protein [Akkermansiaceae bacterium]|nr:DoxX family protein [Akkermansiaceae bacterium]